MHGFYMELQAATSRNRFDCGEVGGFQQLQAVIRGWARLGRPVEFAALIRRLD